MLSVLLSCAFLARQLTEDMEPDRQLRTVLRALRPCQIVAMVGFLVTRAKWETFAVSHTIFGLGFSGVVPLRAGGP